MPNPKPEPATAIIESKLSLLRKYIVEIVIVVLATSVIYLFNAQNKQQTLILEYYKEDKSKDVETISRNNSIIETNNVMMITIKTLVQEIHEQKLNHPTEGAPN
jgi:hypothetical protein